MINWIKKLWKLHKNNENWQFDIMRTVDKSFAKYGNIYLIIHHTDEDTGRTYQVAKICINSNKDVLSENIIIGRYNKISELLKEILISKIDYKSFKLIEI